MLNITGARGATINGLTLHGDNLGSGVHGIYMGANPERREEDAPRIERCHISHFSGDGIHLDPVWCFSVRSCEVIFNKRHGLWMVGWDGFVLDNWFSGNGGAGYAATKANASMTLTGNRIEWNRGGGIMIEGGSHYNITGNYIDRAGGPGITLRGVEGRPCLCMTATGNVIYRSGKPDWTSDEAFSAHALLEKCHGVVFSGNSMCVGRDDSGGLTSPQYGIIIKELKNSIVKGNTLHIGAITELVRDLGGHGEGVVVAENVGSLYSDIDKSIWESGQR
ncbi:MAG: right-handed parallel beta-helix repeat-containing protein [Lentisphaerae bacterium]|nr:right-handed parallel beta-helix repeat-containing protein [Lentisphaerota bacterium]